MSTDTTGARWRRGFGLGEVFLVVLILAFLAFVLFPVFIDSPAKVNRRSPSSNLKQVALALLSYAQDYDERFPPVSGYTRPRTADEGESKIFQVSWGRGGRSRRAS